MAEVAHYEFDALSNATSEIRAKVSAGDELVLDDDGRPIARVIPIRRRQLGLMKGKLVASDDWDSAEVNEEIARDFYDSEIFPP